MIFSLFQTVYFQVYIMLWIPNFQSGLRHLDFIVYRNFRRVLANKSKPETSATWNNEFSFDGFQKFEVLVSEIRAE